MIINSLRELSARLGNLPKSKSPPDVPAPGLYHFLRQSEAEKMRLHLRVEENGTGILLINASRMVHFNPSATVMAYLALNQAHPTRAAAALGKVFNVSARQAAADYANFQEQLHAILSDVNCPVCDLNLEVLAPFSDRPSAPYRMDLALTYRCNNNCSHCYNARSRQFPEMDTAQWKQVIDRVWDTGIPHIVFTGGEPTLRPDLPDLIAYAEQKGIITGLNSNGRKLKDPAFVSQLVQAGLDHVQITLESHLPEIHDHMVAAAGAWNDTITGIQNALATRLFVMTNTTLLAENSLHLQGTLSLLAELGVPTFGLNALIYSGRGAKVGTGLAESSLPPLLDLARQHVEATGQRLIWYTPTQYCHFDPMQLELGVKGCTAALYNMCVEPDGSVLPCQSYYEPLGNILEDPWNSIWRHPLADSLRERKNVPESCTTCALLVECGGGCPLARIANPPNQSRREAK